jgi:uncharacterized protein YggE
MHPMVDPSITVLGHGIARAQPSGLDLHLIVRTKAQTAREALDLAAERTRSLQELLRQHGIADTAWNIVIASVRAERRWVEPRQEEVLVGYIAMGGLAVALDDPSLAGALMAEATARVDAEISGPRWRVDPDNPAWAEARRAAVADARRRATDYAGGLGLALGPVVSVVESTGIHQPHHGRFPTAFASLTSAEDSGEPMEVHAGGIEVAAFVETTFELVPG